MNSPELCADCGAALLAGPFGRQCPRCALALAARWKPAAAEPASVEEATLAAQFPEFRFLGLLGRGGFGAVYKAEHKRLRRPVAVKLLAPALTRSVTVVARFEREIAAVGKLNHPGIVRAFDAGEHDGQWFIAMELVEGANLSEVARAAGRLPVADACELIRQAAVALDYAHQRGLVHRDVKPGNLMLARSDGGPPVVKVLDFGLARMMDDGTSELTLTHEFLGTVEYTAPELVRSQRAVDRRADVYGLGATLYRLLAGVPPHDAGATSESLFSKLVRVGSETPGPVAQRRPDLPAPLAALVDRMVAPKPEDRPATAGEVATLLARFCPGADLAALLARVQPEDAGRKPHAVRVPEPPPPGLLATWRLGGPAAAVLIAVLIAALAAGGWWHRSGDVSESGSKAVATPWSPDLSEAMLADLGLRRDEAPRILEPGWRLRLAVRCGVDARFARFRPRSEELVYGDGRSSMFRVDLAGGSRPALIEPAYNLAFAHGVAGEPRGFYSVYTGLVRRWDPDSEEQGEPFNSPAGSHPLGLAFPPAGWTGLFGLTVKDALAVIGPNEAPDTVWKFPLDAAPEPFALPQPLAGLNDLAFARDAVYFTRSEPDQRVNPEFDGVVRLTATGFVPVLVTPPFRDVSALACAPVSGELFVACGRPYLDAQERRVFHLRRAGSADAFTATPLLEGLRRPARFGLDVSPDGRRLAVTDDRHGLIYVFERE
jgi:tRNA A-37 threonylcarbamoyl transferase component Bud32